MITNCSLSNIMMDLYKGHPPVFDWIVFACLKHEPKNFVKVKKGKNFGCYHHCINYLTKSFEIIMFKKFRTEVVYGTSFSPLLHLPSRQFAY